MPETMDGNEPYICYAFSCMYYYAKVYFVNQV
jgi:hypothetical protein